MVARWKTGNNAQLKIEGVLSKLNYLLMNMIGEEKNKLRTEIYMNSYSDSSINYIN